MKSMMAQQKKPVGRCGPIRITPAGPVRELLQFPADKAERERMIADLFVLNRAIPRGDDKFGPFANPRQNDENDLDFTIETRDGAKLLELAEFAPLAALKTSYQKAPRQLTMRDCAQLFFEVIMKKSKHQGGANRLLLIYKTHDAFFFAASTKSWCSDGCAKARRNSTASIICRRVMRPERPFL